MLADLEQQCALFVCDLEHSDSAHHIDHVRRVVALAKHLAKQEHAQLEVVVPAAWLHDCVSLAKNHPQRHLASQMAADKALEFLSRIRYPQAYFAAIHHAIVAHSYSADVKPNSIEAEVVQDADRLDALGAIGLSRCLQVGTSLNRPLYNQHDPFCLQRCPDDREYTLDHFYSKLLHISESVCTPSARCEAQLRTQFMLNYLQQLKHELRPS
ncbi:HD domain-containing protein [Agarivorans sp. MS3-6]